mmetsp:Transcript_324/g.935  ORF Transcript_324/g.935 Transcript_324/m.935 type:complete len:216 (-) Transcript_324:171-818(-)
MLSLARPSSSAPTTGCWARSCSCSWLSPPASVPSMSCRSSCSRTKGRPPQKARMTSPAMPCCCRRSYQQGLRSSQQLNCRGWGAAHQQSPRPVERSARGASVLCACRCVWSRPPRRAGTCSAGSASRSGAIRSRSAPCAAPPSPPLNLSACTILTCDCPGVTAFQLGVSWNVSFFAICTMTEHGLLVAWEGVMIGEFEGHEPFCHHVCVNSGFVN